MFAPHPHRLPLPRLLGLVVFLAASMPGPGQDGGRKVAGHLLPTLGVGIDPIWMDRFQDHLATNGLPPASDHGIRMSYGVQGGDDTTFLLIRVALSKGDARTELMQSRTSTFRLDLGGGMYPLRYGKLRLGAYCGLGVRSLHYHMDSLQHDQGGVDLTNSQGYLALGGKLSFGGRVQLDLTIAGTLPWRMQQWRTAGTGMSAEEIPSIGRYAFADLCLGYRIFLLRRQNAAGRT